MKSLYVGDFRYEIKILHFLQMGEIWAILFLLPHAQHTLAKHRIFDDLLPDAQCTLANCYSVRSIRLQIATVCKACASNLLL
jgi:hypothetical protein